MSKTTPLLHTKNELRNEEDVECESHDGDSSLIIAETERLRFENYQKCNRIKSLKKQMQSRSERIRKLEQERSTSNSTIFRFLQNQKQNDLQLNLSIGHSFNRKNQQIQSSFEKSNDELLKEHIEMLKKILKSRHGTVSNLKELYEMNKASIEQLSMQKREVEYFQSDSSNVSEGSPKAIVLKEKINSLRQVMEMSKKHETNIRKEIEEAEKKWETQEPVMKNTMNELQENISKIEAEIARASILNILIKKYSLIMFDSVCENLNETNIDDTSDVNKVINHELLVIRDCCEELQKCINSRQADREKSIVLFEQLEPFLNLAQASRKSVHQLNAVRAELAHKCQQLLTTLEFSYKSQDTVKAGLLSLKAKIVHLHGSLDSDKKILSSLT